MDFCTIRTTAKLLKLHSSTCIEKSDQSSTVRPCCQHCATVIRGHGSNSRLVRGNNSSPLSFDSRGRVPGQPRVEDHQSATLLHARTYKHCSLHADRQAAQTLRVANCLDRIEQRKASKSINVDLSFQGHYQEIPSKTNRLHRTWKLELGDGTRRSIVPKHHSLRLEPWISSTTSESQNIRSKQHRDHPKSTTAIIKISTVCQTERVSTINTKSSLRADDEASVVLVEANVEDLITRITLQVEGHERLGKAMQL
mmetsp:Transcript_64515/g.101773  ORF Transcript_64515/g.101773 Transcript_64515/m.101773 type:complete len:254 (+) Transcript_64515:831-1592(+)